MSTRTPDYWSKALAEVVYGIRQHAHRAGVDRWDLPGIRAAVDRLAAELSPADVARVMVNGADNPRIKTPGGISAPGPQWEGTSRSAAKAPTFCPDHPDVPVLRCPCQREQARHATRMPDNFRDLVDAARGTDDERTDQ